MNKNKVVPFVMNELAVNFKEKVGKLEQTMYEVSKENPLVEFGTKEKPIVSTESNLTPIRNFFMDNVYIRQIFLFKGTLSIGAIYKHKHMIFLLHGHVTIANEKGVKDYTAPCHIISTPGDKRVVYAHETTVWYNVFPNVKNKKDVRELEKDIACVSYEEYENYVNNK
tara:strand:+ start:559 stop:1062 length:504 start_codon:yes stop_codon:yes gene_type:complete